MRMNFSKKFNQQRKPKVSTKTFGFSCTEIPMISRAVHRKLLFPMKRMKGIMHMVEAVIAITMILSFLIVLKAKMQPAEDTGREQAIAFKALQALDKQGVMRSYAIEEDYTGLDAQANQVIPADFSHATRLCYAGERCVGAALPDKNVFTAAYVIAGNETVFKPVQILLHVWR